MTRIDHITVTAPSLEKGHQWVLEQLGVESQKGGEHPRMGTHNRFIRLGDAMFLEIIAVNPAAEEPSHPRWFNLDNLSNSTEPKLACWVARTENIHHSMTCTEENLGEAEPITRGSLEWLITIPKDGSLPLKGIAPALIQWQADRHPALGMQDQGCSIKALELRHPEPERIKKLLVDIELFEPEIPISVIQAPSPGLAVQILSPNGVRIIGR